MLTEVAQQETVLKNRINYLAKREDKVLRELEEKQRKVEIHDSMSKDRLRNLQLMDISTQNSHVISSLNKQFQQKQKVITMNSIQDKKLALY